MWLRLSLGLVVAILVAWATLVAFLVAAKPKGSLLAETTRILPDALRLIRRLAADGSLAGGVRLRLWLLLAYVAVPIDLIPDFIPVVGYADDAVIVGAVLRSVVRGAGPEAVKRHWPGTPDGLAALWRAANLPGDVAR